MYLVLSAMIGNGRHKSVLPSFF